MDRKPEEGEDEQNATRRDHGEAYQIWKTNSDGSYRYTYGKHVRESIIDWLLAHGHAVV